MYILFKEQQLQNMPLYITQTWTGKNKEGVIRCLCPTYIQMKTDGEHAIHILVVIRIILDI